MFFVNQVLKPFESLKALYKFPIMIMIMTRNITTSYARVAC